MSMPPPRSARPPTGRGPAGGSAPLAAPPGAGLNLRGAVDLGALAAQSQRRAQGTAGAGAGEGAGEDGSASGSFVIDTTDATFADDAVQASGVVPVVLDFASPRSPASAQLTPLLELLATEGAGRWLLARVDVDANPQLVAAFAVQSIPSVFAMIKGQPVPLFQGAPAEQQVRQVIGELLTVAEQNGVSGRLPGAAEGEGEEGESEEPAEPPLPPLHQQAYDAIERDDLDAAIAAYQQALREAPADAMAKAGLAQVQLMARVRGVDVAAARAAAAASPADVDAAMLVADIDVTHGHVEDAFGRLVDSVRSSAGEDREQVRARLVELFEVVGGDDPRVARARTALASALF